MVSTQLQDSQEEGDAAAEEREEDDHVDTGVLGVGESEQADEGRGPDAQLGSSAQKEVDESSHQSTVKTELPQTEKPQVKQRNLRSNKDTLGQTE